MRIRPPVHGWVQLAHTRRKDGTTQAEVLVDFGREDRPDVGARRRLVASINRYLGTEDDPVAPLGTETGPLTVESSWLLGG
ncbi:hypothetical protein [Streptomyces tirandamycinicus]|uniref:Uncharacterized protein n=1 Tax=Streptomyces tirandamycinicus TaxID=2174846 RepID=A0A2S1SP70_9ACTN|nr:hypothetical protein [Streptomyces tirandamycinicus]AWI28166.1 hypothetical protein DDW44_04675 [Streptomyces tirandamycinicus]